MIIPQIGDLKEIISKMNEKEAYGLVVLNTNNNFQMLIDNWKELIRFNFLTLYFVNPFSKLDKKWVINPHVHSKICDDNSLKTGLKSMFDMVTPLTDGEIEQKFK